MMVPTAARPSFFMRLDRTLTALILGTLACAYAATLAPGITWANGGADSGDFVTAAATMGVAHPTGYPTYLLLARLFQFLPIGDLAYRTNLLSAASAAGAALCVYTTVRWLVPAPCWRASAAAALGALGLGLSPLFWAQAIIAEVYSLNALFTVLLVLWALPPRQQAEWTRGWRERLQGIVAGLALGNHLTVGLAVLAWLFCAGGGLPAPARARRCVRRLAWVGIGLLVYLYLPLRAAAHPPVNWGAAADWTGFWWTVSGQPYRGLAFGLPAQALPARAAAWAALLVGQFGGVGLGLGLLGLFYGTWVARRCAWLTAGLAAAYSAFAIGYDTADSYAYLLPAFAIFAIWLGLGVEVALAALQRRGPALASVGAALLAVALAWRIPSIAREVDASQDRRAIAFATRALAAAPPNAIVITTSDQDSFALWYYHYALGQRLDILVVVEPLLAFDWYRENLHAAYPALQLPTDPDRNWAATVTAANPAIGPVCRTDVAHPNAIACESAAHQK